MQAPRTRRVARVHLAHALMAKLGSAQVVIVDVSVLGARVEHPMPLIAGSHSRLSFRWEADEIVADCRIARSRIERFSTGADGLTVYHSGLEFENMTAEMLTRLKEMLECFISRALLEQKLNARGVVPDHDLNRMPIFRHGGQLTANMKERPADVSAVLPVARMTRDAGYICCHLENNRWRRKHTHDPGQPSEGFTISATEGITQVELLCEAYAKSDHGGRRMIQLFAQLSLVEGEGVAGGRFEP